jgi:eukaryotic-like serine/threonine-protein kinase
VSKEAFDRRVADLLDEVLALPAAQRKAWIERLGADDPMLCQRVERLIELASVETGFLDQPLVAGVAPSVPQQASAAEGASRSGERIGAYQLVRRLGAGGMGEVWLAERAEGGFRQQVAIKRLHFESPDLIARFDAEREILAGLEHPGIARLYDGGIGADGRPYMVVEYVEGEDLLAWCERRRAPLNLRLNLFLQVCEAVAHAHAQLVVHRDLKPANILVTTDGRVKLLDFGIAKLLMEHGGSDASAATLALSPAYAAPEQLTGGAVGTATDVHALGVILYQLLAGRLPWTLTDLPLATAVQRLANTVPPSPSAAVVAGHPLPARALAGDLDAIVARTLRFERQARYADARALAEDIERHLRHEPVRARQGARSYVLRRFLRRHWLPLGATAAIFAALALGLLGVMWQAGQARQQAARAEAVQDFLLDIFRSNSSRHPDPARARQTTARELLDLGAARIDTAFEHQPATRLSLLMTLGGLYHELAEDDEAVRLFRRAEALARESPGSDPDRLAEALVALAGATHASSAVGERAAILDEAAALLQRGGQSGSELHARLLRLRAEHLASSDLPASLEAARSAVALYQRWGPSAGLAESWFAQGMAHYNQGDMRAAGEALREAVAAAREAEGERSASLPRFLAVLGDVQFRLLDIAAARESLRQAVAAAEALHGEAHVDILQTRMRLGRLLFDTGETGEALAILDGAREMALALRGEDDPFHTPQIRLEYGFALARAGQPLQGLAEMQRAIDNRRQHRPDTLYLAQMLEFAATAQVTLARYTDAEAALLEAAGIRDRAGQARPSTGWNHHIGVAIRLALEHNDTARALDLVEQLAVVEHAQAPLSLSRIERDMAAAHARMAKGEFDQAARLAIAVREQIEHAGLAAFLPFQLASADLTTGLAMVRGDLAQEALPVVERAVMLRDELLLPEALGRAEARLALAEVWLVMGREEEARALARKALDESATGGWPERPYRRVLETLSIGRAHAAEPVPAAASPGGSH